jgi:hypothetical protein
MEKEGTNLESNENVKKVLMENTILRTNWGRWSLEVPRFDGILDFVVESVIE